MKKFHITIKNNETGEITHDLDTNAIVAGILDDDGAYAVGITHCDSLGLLQAINSAENLITSMYKKHPELLILKLMVDRTEDGEEVEETEEATEDTEN